jgi:hypothetical protein
MPGFQAYYEQELAEVPDVWGFAGRSSDSDTSERDVLDFESKT